MFDLCVRLVNGLSGRAVQWPAEARTAGGSRTLVTVLVQVLEGTHAEVIVLIGEIVETSCNNVNITICNNVNITIYDNVIITIYDNVNIIIYVNVNITIYDNVNITIYDVNITIYDNVTIIYDNVNITIYDNVNITIYDNINITIYDNVNITIYDNVNITITVIRFTAIKLEPHWRTHWKLYCSHTTSADITDNKICLMHNKSKTLKSK